MVCQIKEEISNSILLGAQTGKGLQRLILCLKISNQPTPLTALKVRGPDQLFNVKIKLINHKHANIHQRESSNR